MKLIKRGVDPKTVLRHATCNKCKSEYEFTLSDPEVKRTYDLRAGDFYSFPCQVCKNIIYLSTLNPPGAA